MDNSTLSEYALTIAQKRYFIDEYEDWSDLSYRVGGEVARAENGGAKEYREKFAEIIYNMEFLPGGRILRNTGRPRGSLFNCYVLPVGDSREEIGQWLKDSLILWGEGGGVGCNLSYLRPRGAVIKGVGGTSSGPVSFLEASDAVANTIESGGSRRAAALACMSVTHPDIMEFIDAKTTHGRLSHYNISVAVTEAFLLAVEADEMWEFKFAQQSYGEIKAREIWDKIIESMVKHGEPGLLHWDNLTSNNSYYFAPILATNPCVAGSTLMAVADGRNAVSIRQLAKEGKDVPIYSTDINTGKVEIKLGRNPRRTGIKKEIWKLTLDDGSYFLATPDHEILTKELDYVHLKDLKQGQSIFPFNSFNSNGYRQICNTGVLMAGGARRNRRQYRLIYENNHGEVDPKEFALHHGDFNSFNDSFANLIHMSHTEHREIHAKKMRGKNNPYHKMSDAWKFNFASHPGESNPKYSGQTNDELIDAGRKLYIKYGKFTQKVWCKYALENNYPLNVATPFRFGKFSNFKSLVVGNHKVKSVEFYGYEDVYNITVDNNHNYHVITSMEDDRYIKSSGICVKNCGEAPLAGNGVCDLGSLVLSRFVTTNGQTQRTRLKEVIALAVRFLDNIIDINKYVLNDIDVNAHAGRRIGLGVMGLSEYLFAKGVTYGSEKAIEETESIMKLIRNTAYETSIELAVEKGAYPRFDPVQYGKAHFIRTLPARMRMAIKEKGIRNVTCMAMAPTGTISLLPEVSSGIEPLFGKAYVRNDRVSNRVYVHSIYKNHLETDEELPDWFVDATDLNPTDHFEIQSIVQKYTDGAVSKTINMPKGTTSDELSRFTLEYIHDLKGVTVYVDGCREQQIATHLSEEEARRYLETGDVDSVADESSTNCATGACEL